MPPPSSSSAAAATATTSSTRRPIREKVYALPRCGGSCNVVDCQSNLAVIVTHPWKPLGGNMHNNVVVAACLYFQHLGITTARFDFVGLYGRGYGHVQQVQEVAELLLSGKAASCSSSSSNNRRSTSSSSSSSKPPQSILLVGYSYGALITGSASAEIPQCIGTVSIAPPFAVSCWLLFFNSQHHLNQAAKRGRNNDASSSNFVGRLFVIGDNDNFTSESAFREVLETQFPSSSSSSSSSQQQQQQQGGGGTTTTTGAVIKGADHFFWKREKDLMDVIGQWLLQTFDGHCAGNLKNLRSIEFAAINDASSTSTASTVAAAGRSTSPSAPVSASDLIVGSCFS
jgi:alpha/beta superfamily hydrolase